MNYRELICKLVKLSSAQLDSTVYVETQFGMVPAQLCYSDEDKLPNLSTDTPILLPK